MIFLQVDHTQVLTSTTILTGMVSYFQACSKVPKYQICNTLGITGWIFMIYCIQIDQH